MMIYKLSGDVDELLGRPVGEAAAVESVGVDPLNVVPIAEAFDESVTVEQLPIPWDQIDETSSVGVTWNADPNLKYEVVSIEDPEQSSFSEMLPAIENEKFNSNAFFGLRVEFPEEALQSDYLATAEQPTTPAGPTNEQVIARKLQLCDLIQHVGDEIQAVDEEIAELSSELKAAKKLRESKLERLQELSQELKNARRDLAEKQKAAATYGDAGEGSDGGDETDDDLSTREEAEGDDESDATDFDPDAYNPWDLWEQGRAITCVRLLVATEGMVAGTSCSVFDIEPPQVEGDSLSGSVTVFRLGSDRETVVLSKRECAPMLPGVKEPPIGHRIGVRPKAKAKVNAPTKQNQPEDDSWKSVPVSDLDIPSSLVAILVEDNSIRTIGDIQEFARWNRLTDLKKVGQAKAEKIEEALVEFWKKR